jgi:hypothetical protein
VIDNPACKVAHAKHLRNGYSRRPRARGRGRDLPGSHQHWHYQTACFWMSDWRRRRLEFGRALRSSDHQKETTPPGANSVGPASPSLLFCCVQSVLYVLSTLLPGIVCEDEVQPLSCIHIRSHAETVEQVRPAASKLSDQRLVLLLHLLR